MNHTIPKEEPSLVVGILWLLVMFYIMLFCQHRVCEAYFVPALNVLMDTMGSSKNPWLKRLGDPGVAGATFMALGANGPELFTNLFSIYAGSDGGIGVVIGSEIFNLLVIIGASIVANKAAGALELEKVSFARDVIYYAFSIALLLWALADCYISKLEAGVMLLAGLSYWMVVYSTEDIAKKCCGKVEDEAATGGGEAKTKIRGVDVEVEQIFHARMADGHGHQAQHVDLQVSKSGIYVPELEDTTAAGKRGSVGFNYSSMNDMLEYKNLDEIVIVAEGALRLNFLQPDGLPGLTLVVKTSGKKDRDKLLQGLKDNAPQDSKNPGATQLFIHDYDATPRQAWASFKHHLAGDGILIKIYAVLHFFIDFLLSSTLFWCDVKDVNKEKRWIACFMGAMLWLAAFSFAMVQVMGEISSHIAFFTPMLIGVTFGAIGTSLPNAMGSVIMAQQGKPAAAIGNAFGSNVQNVFLAMAGPWMIYLCTTGLSRIQQEPLPTDPVEKGQSISEGVTWMLGTLVLVVVFALLPPSGAFSKSNGFVFLATYVGYLGWTTYEFAAAE